MPSPAELAEARQFLVYKSILRDSGLMDVRRVDGIIQHTIDLALHAAVSEEGNGPWIARTLHPGDMPPVTTTAREWIETTGTTTESFIAAAIGNGTSIADDVFIGIYGFKFHASRGRNGVVGSNPYAPPVTSLRFTVGGTRVAEWDLYSVWKALAVRGSATSSVSGSGAAIEFPTGIAESPIIITQNKTLLLEYYEQVPTVATEFLPQVLGVVVEKRGAGDGLNP